MDKAELKHHVENIKNLVCRISEEAEDTKSMEILLLSELDAYMKYCTPTRTICLYKHSEISGSEAIIGKDGSGRNVALFQNMTAGILTSKYVTVRWAKA